MRRELEVERHLMPAHCPLDGTELLLASTDGSRGCPACRGVWLPGPLVSNCVGDDVTTVLKGTRGEATRLSCPDDRANLTKVRFHGIALDLCADCCGVWFDRQDLDGLHQHRQALGIGASGDIPVHTERMDSEGSWEDSLIHFILFAARR